MHIETYTDGTKMKFGKHQNKPLVEVPASYLIWWHNENRALMNYVIENMEALEEEALKADIKRREDKRAAKLAAKE